MQILLAIILIVIAVILFLYKPIKNDDLERAANVGGVIATIAAIVVLAFYTASLDSNGEQVNPSTTVNPTIVIDDTLVPLSTPHVTPIPSETTTPTETLAPTVTFTATITATPSIVLPFTDNFDNGISPVWKTTTGTWRTINGQLTADPSDDYSIIFVGDENWTDYTIDVDVHKYNVNSGYPVGIIVRAKNGNYLMYKMNCCSTDWVLFNGTSETIIAHIDDGITMGYNESSEHHFHVEVVGDTYTGSIDGKLFLKVSDPTLSSGVVGLAFQYSHLDVFRFDDFQIVLP